MISGTARSRAAALPLAGALALLTACGATDDGQAGPAGNPQVEDRRTDSPMQVEGGPGDAVTEVALTLADGQVEGVEDRVETTVGSTVRVVVESDETEELHLHGYDLYLDLEPGAPATLEFVADIPGVFEAELHGSGAQLFLLQVG